MRINQKQQNRSGPNTILNYCFERQTRIFSDFVYFMNDRQTLAFSSRSADLPEWGPEKGFNGGTVIPPESYFGYIHLVRLPLP